MEPGLGDALFAPAERVDRYLDGYLDGVGLPGNLLEAVKYALLGGGKRLRPVLAWHACVAAGGTGESSLAAGAAVELIHAFSLVHDDLPAMDDDDLRRGRPTLHRHAGEAMAILAGDAMTSLAFQVLVERAPGPALAAAWVRELAVGTTGMIAGQVYDTLGGFESHHSVDERLVLTHRNKTGALIRAACRMGAMAGLSDRGVLTPVGAELTAATTLGDALGLMFQVVDDLMDVEQSPEHTGKRTGKDAEAGKLTYPGVWGAEASRREIDRLRGEAHAAADTFGSRGAGLHELTDFLAGRTK